MCRIRWTQAVAKDNEYNKGPNSCLEDGEEENKSKLLKESNGGGKHNGSGSDRCYGCSQDAGAHSDQSIFGTCVAVDVPREKGICVSKVNHEIATDTNQDGKQNGLQTASNTESRNVSQSSGESCIQYQQGMRGDNLQSKMPSHCYQHCCY